MQVFHNAAAHVSPIRIAHDAVDICIVTNAPICSNPRVIKEADALATAGFNVRVVESQHVAWTAEWDSELMAGRSWHLDAIRWDDRDLNAKRIRIISGASQHVFRVLAEKVTFQGGLAERAYCRLYNQLLRRA